MKYNVGVSDMHISKSPGDIIVTHALGSCIGISIHDSVAGVGGILHYMLPLSKIDEQKAQRKPLMFGDIAIPQLFKAAYSFGAQKKNIRVVMAGGAQVFVDKGSFNIGKRNILIARKLFWKNNIIISQEHIGDHIPRTLYLEVGSGETWFTSNGKTIKL